MVFCGEHMSSFLETMALKINCELDLIKVSEDEILEKINDLIDFVMAAEISSYMLNVINKI